MSTNWPLWFVMCKKSGSQVRRTGLRLILWGKNLVIEYFHYEIHTNYFWITIVRNVLVLKSVKQWQLPSFFSIKWTFLHPSLHCRQFMQFQRSVEQFRKPMCSCVCACVFYRTCAEVFCNKYCHLSMPDSNCTSLTLLKLS